MAGQKRSTGFKGNKATLPSKPCVACGRPMSFGRSDGGRWFACCPLMWVYVGDGRTEHNYPNHSLRLLSRPPRWGDCHHGHELRHPLRGYPV